MGEEWMGAFWRSDANERAGGRLELHDDGVRLTVYGSIADWSVHDLGHGIAMPLSEPHRSRVLLGDSTTPLSILDAWCNVPTLPGESTAEVWNASAVLEAHVLPDGDDEIRFSGIKAEMSSLPAWCGAESVEVDLDAAGKFTISATHRSYGTASVGAGVTLTIDQGVESHSYGRSGQAVERPVRIGWEVDSGATLGTLLNDWVQPMQALLWLALGRPGRLGQLHLAVRVDEELVRWHRVHLALIEPRSAPLPAWPWEMLFTRAELPGGFETGLQRWFELWPEIRHVLGPLHARLTAPFAYANDRFYTAIAALEAHHQLRSDSIRELDRVDHRARVRRLRDVLNEHAPDLSDWAGNAAEPFNRIPLWKRIAQIACQFPDTSTALFGDRVEGFARAAESARHGHAHSSGHGGAMTDGSHLYHAADALICLLRCRLAVDLGFEPKLIDERLTKQRRLAWLAERVHGLLDDLQINPDERDPCAEDGV